MAVASLSGVKVHMPNRLRDITFVLTGLSMGASVARDSLALLTETLGSDHRLVQAGLAGKAPKEPAAELIAGSKLGDIAERKRLAAGGKRGAAHRFQ